MLKEDYMVPEKKTLKNYYYINAISSLKEYDLFSLITEARTKEQQEIGQREMAKKSLEPINKIKEYFFSKWDNLHDVKQKSFEKKRYNEVLQSLKSIEIDKDIGNYIKNVTGKYPESSFVGRDVVNHFVELYKGIPAIGLSTEEQKNINGINFNNDKKEIRKLVRQFIILHEYGHLYDYLKQYIETGEYKIIDTIFGDKDEVTNSESDANNYAFNSIYRKDRRKLLVNSDLTKEKINKAKDELNSKEGYHKSSQYIAKSKYFKY